MPCRKTTIFWLCLLISMSACTQPVNTPISTQLSATVNPAVQTQVATMTAPTSTVEPTEVPERTLVVCLGQEPSTLYLYGGSSNSMWSVLEGIYDGPIDTENFEPKAVILEKLPDLADGSASITAVDVSPGEIVVDPNGNLVALEDGVLIQPAGCTSAECAVAWDSSSPVQMDQLSAQFKLLPGITWSDGAALTASDSVFSYQISFDPATPVSDTLLDRTASYTAVDDLTVEWRGIPGYLPLDYDTYFWLPLPEHAWSVYSAADLLEVEDSTRRPLGWGPYVIDEWVEGDHITLSKNPLYFRASEGLPKFDTVVFRFPGNPASGYLEALRVGECDIVDRTAGLEEVVQEVREQEIAGSVRMYVGEGPDWEQVTIGINPSSYDDGYSLYHRDRADLFSDIRMRKALAYCMDRQGIVSKFLYDMSSVPVTYLLPSHPLFAEGLEALPYDVEAGQGLLDEIGWKDLDGDPSTPRISQGVANIGDGTELVIEYATTEATLRKEVAEELAISMAECGIKLEVAYYTPDAVYAAGPDGLLFGRNFDLAQLAWKGGVEPACGLYISSQIPTNENDWLGVNVAGYNNPEYDTACLRADSAKSGQEEVYIEAQKEAQRIFSEDLPAIPLYFRLKVVASRPDLCGMTMDVTARSDLWNLESIDYGENCSTTE